MPEQIEVSIQYAVGSAGVRVTPLGDERYRIESEPFSCMMAERARDMRRLPSYRDVIEAQVVAPDVLRFVKVVTRARWKRVMFFVDQETAESPRLERVVTAVEELNGHWERLFGGLLVIYLPPGSGFDPLKELNS